MIFTKLILFSSLLLLSNACSNLKTPNKNLPFAKDIDLARLEGKYRNKSEGSSRSQAVYLSQLIFSNFEVKHDTIDTVVVKKDTHDKLLVAACRSHQIVATEVFKENHDFKIEKGRIWLIRKSDFSFAYPAGNPFIGYFSEKQSIGLDAAGNGKLENSAFGIGTVFVIVPIAINDKEEFRFNRISEDKSCI